MFHVERTPSAACRTGRDAPAVAPIKKSLGRSGRAGSPAPTPPPVRSLPLAACQVEQHPRQLPLPKTHRQTAPPKTHPLTHPSKPPVETGGSATEPGSRAGQLNPAHTGPRPCRQQPTHAGSPAPALPPVRSLPLAAYQVEQHPRQLLLPKTIPADSRHPQSLPAASPTKTLPGPTPASPRWKPGDQPQHKVPFPTRTAVASMAARFTMVVSRETGKAARLRKPGRFHVKRHHHAATDDKNNDSCRYTDSTLHAWWFHY